MQHITRLFEVSRDGAAYDLPEGADIVLLGIDFFCGADGPAEGEQFLATELVSGQELKLSLLD